MNAYSAMNMETAAPLHAVAPRPASARPAGNPLADKALLCTLAISAWSARALDKGASRRVTSDAGAAADAARVNKLLISKDSLATITSIATEARTLFYSSTMPWSNKGARLLPAVEYLDFTAKVQALRLRFNEARDVFVSLYPDIVADARGRLGDLYDSEDYPDPADIGRRFVFKVGFSNVPDAADFRVSVAAEHAERIRADMEAEARETVTLASREAAERVAEAVGNMVERLRAYRPGDGKGTRAEGVFRDSLVENVRDIARMLPSFNFAGDPELDRIAARLESICRDDAETLRENPTARASVADEAERILSEVSAFLA